MIGADDFDFITKMQQAKIRAEDFARHQDASAGRETGFDNRHAKLRSEKLDAKLARNRIASTTLDLLMQDAAYRDAYQQTYKSLTETETVLHDALLRYQEKLDEARKALKGAKDAGANVEDIKRLKRNVADAKDKHDHLLGYDSELQGIRDHIQDKDNPPSQAELDEYQKRIGEIGADIEQHNEAHKEAKPETEMSSAIEVRSTDMDIPTI
jgi:hypothetical protein